MQVLVNPTDVVFRKSQHKYAYLPSGMIFDAVALDGGGVVGYLLLEACRICMKLKDQIGYVTFNGHQTTRGAVDTLAAELNLAVDWKAMDPKLVGYEETNGRL